MAEAKSILSAGRGRGKTLGGSVDREMAWGGRRQASYVGSLAARKWKKGAATG
jgi:hypothetical protein